MRLLRCCPGGLSVKRAEGVSIGVTCASGRVICSRWGIPAATTGCVPLLARGQAFQFDWSEDWAVIGGERQKLLVA